MDTQAFTQAPVKAPATLAGHAGRDAESAALDDEWTVDDVVRSIRKVDRAPHHARRWAAAVRRDRARGRHGRPSACRQITCRDAEAGGAAVANRRGCRGTRHVPGRRVAGARGAPVAGRGRGGPSARLAQPERDRRHAGRPGLPVGDEHPGRRDRARPAARSAHPLRPRRAVRRRTPRRGHGPGGLRGALRRGARPRRGRSTRPMPSSGSATRPTRRRPPSSGRSRSTRHRPRGDPSADGRMRTQDRGAGAIASAPQRAAMTAISTL